MSKDLSRLHLRMEIEDVPLLNKDQEHYHRYYNFNVYVFDSENGEQHKEVGNISLLRLDFTEFGVFETLDIDSDTIDFLELFTALENDEETKLRAEKNFEDLYLNSFMFVLHKVSIIPEYRGQKILRPLLLKALEIINIDEVDLIALVFPLQHSNKGDLSAKFYDDRDKLVNYYKEVGFKTLVEKKNVFMCLEYRGEVE